MKANVKEKNPVIVAVDQGNSYIKTQDTVNPTHVFEVLDEDILDDERRKIVIDGKTYIETSKTLPQTDNKATQKVKICTLAAIGDQLLKIGKTAKIIEENIALLLGVPNDSNFKLSDAVALQKYFGTPKVQEYDYLGHHFKITISEVSIYRQGKAIMELIGTNTGRVTIIDIGGQTTDVIHYEAASKDVIYTGMLDRSGMKSLIRTVSSRISTLDNKIRPEDFEEFLVTGSGIDKPQKEKAKRYINGWAEEMISSVSEEIFEGLPIRKFGKVYLAGGGAQVLEPYIRETLRELGVQDGDIKLVQDAQTANARAYVQLKRKSMATAKKN